MDFHLVYVSAGALRLNKLHMHKHVFHLPPISFTLAFQHISTNVILHRNELELLHFSENEIIDSILIVFKTFGAHNLCWIDFYIFAWKHKQKYTKTVHGKKFNRWSIEWNSFSMAVWEKKTIAKAQITIRTIYNRDRERFIFIGSVLQHMCMFTVLFL